MQIYMGDDFFINLDERMVYVGVDRMKFEN